MAPAFRSVRAPSSLPPRCALFRPVDPASLEPWGSFSEDFRKKPYIQAQQPVSWGLEAMTWDDWAPVVARYHEAVSQMDDAVGRLLDKLRALGQEEHTVVLFTTDHGDHGRQPPHAR